MEVVTNNWFTKKYPIGFALSGGFIKGFAHLGAMQSLLEHDIKPNIPVSYTHLRAHETGT